MITLELFCEMQVKDFCEGEGEVNFLDHGLYISALEHNMKLIL